MAKLSTDELLDAFKEMTLLELSDFVKQFEDTFDVTAAAPVAVAAPAAGGGGGAEAEAAEEQDEFDVILEGAARRRSGHQEVRTLTTRPEAKDRSTARPSRSWRSVNMRRLTRPRRSWGRRRQRHRQVVHSRPCGVRPYSIRERRADDSELRRGRRIAAPYLRR
jgi:large subunit ribosomal protein L7/L12